MIHDVLLSLLSQNLDKSPLHHFLDSGTVELLHPCEKQILQNILGIGDKYREILVYLNKYGKQTLSCSNKTQSFDGFREDENIHGIYIETFFDGIELTLYDYRKSIQDLECRYLRKPDHTLLLIEYEISKYDPLFSFLLKLIEKIIVQRIHGCAVLNFLDQHKIQANQEFSKAIQIIFKQVYKAFLKQLQQWVLYGKFYDKYNEFFIQSIETKSIPSGSSEKHSRVGSPFTIVSDNDSNIDFDVWKYEIVYDMRPMFFSSGWVQKVLFIGQTVLMFASPPKDSTKRTDLWNNANNTFSNFSIFGDEEQKFIKKFNELFTSDTIQTALIENIIDEIKMCVTNNLFNFAINEADLIQQLYLIKDYFLIGRGDLFLQFIKNINHILKTAEISDVTIRDLNRELHASSASVNAGDEVEIFSFIMNKELNDYSSRSTSNTETNFINCLILKYDVKWPLHLIFTPKVLINYNETFKFLLRIKKIQYDLSLVWTNQREKKIQKNSKSLQLRNKLIFLIDNLQYYLQVDVIESQFKILMDTINSKKDFESIQTAHAIFQANILSLCFLMNSFNINETSHSSVIHLAGNPIYSILNEILSLIDSFCNLSLKFDVNDVVQQEIEQKIDEYESTFNNLMDSLLKLFVGFKAGPSHAPLSQLLLRLDFNYYFSSKISVK